MVSSYRTLRRLRTVVLLVGLAILGFVYALLAPVVPVQVFYPTGNCVFCPLILSHSQHVPGGFVTPYLYSVSRALTGFGASFNVDEGYVPPSGIQDPSGNSLTGFGVFGFILLPLILAAVACFAISEKIRRMKRLTLET